MQSMNRVEVDFTELDFIVESELKKLWKNAQVKVKANTPELSGDLEENILLTDVKRGVFWRYIEVYTNLKYVPYAKIVEDWVKSKRYQYHKPAGVAFWPKQVWAKMYQKVATEYQKVWAINSN